MSTQELHNFKGIPCNLKKRKRKKTPIILSFPLPRPFPFRQNPLLLVSLPFSLCFFNTVLYSGFSLPTKPAPGVSPGPRAAFYLLRGLEQVTQEPHGLRCCQNICLLYGVNSLPGYQEAQTMCRMLIASFTRDLGDSSPLTS